jgi:hypothetical protein
MLVALLAAGCAQRSASGGTPPPSGGHDLILRIDVGGGFLAPQAQLRQVPPFALYADGRLIVPGPQIEIYPGPALPNLQVRKVSQGGIQAIVAVAQAAGLLGPDRHYDAIRVADAPTTTFTLVASGARHVVSVQALGTPPAQGATPQETDARRKLTDLQSKLTDLETLLQAGSLGPEEPFVTDELRVYVSRYQPPQDLMQKTIDWPLGSFKGLRPLPDNGEIRCGTVSGPDLKSVLTAAGRANELTPWGADGERWTVVFRPLLPDESDCA